MITVKNNLDELDKIYDMLLGKAEEYGLLEDIQNDLCVCVDEVFSNIVKYAYDDDGQHDITIEFEYERPAKKIIITLTDDGKAFNPVEAPKPELSVNLIEREIGGLGVFIVSNIMSRVKYRRLNNINMLEMSKDID